MSVLRWTTLCCLCPGLSVYPFPMSMSLSHQTRAQSVLPYQICGGSWHGLTVVDLSLLASISYSSVGRTSGSPCIRVGAGFFARASSFASCAYLPLPACSHRHSVPH